MAERFLELLDKGELSSNEEKELIKILWDSSVMYSYIPCLYIQRTMDKLGSFTLKGDQFVIGGDDGSISWDDNHDFDGWPGMKLDVYVGEANGSYMESKCEYTIVSCIPLEAITWNPKPFKITTRNNIHFFDKKQWRNADLVKEIPAKIAMELSEERKYIKNTPIDKWDLYEQYCDYMGVCPHGYIFMTGEGNYLIYHDDKNRAFFVFNVPELKN